MIAIKRVLIIFIFFAMIMPHAANAQLKTFHKRYGGDGDDDASSVAQTSDGGYIIFGSTKSFGAGGSDMYLVKLDADCHQLWYKTYGGKEDERGKVVEQTLDGGYILFGFSESFGKGKSAMYLIKTDSDGKVEWENTYGDTGSDYGHSMKRTRDGGYIMLGHTDKPFTNKRSDIYVVKTDSIGEVKWERTFGKNDEDIGYSVAHTSDRGFVLFGNSGKTDKIFFNSMMIYKLNKKGRKLWNLSLRGKSGYAAHNVLETNNGDLMFLGTVASGNSSSIYLLKTDSKGKRIWEKSIKRSKAISICSMEMTSDGGYIIATNSAYEGSNESIVSLIRIDADGNETWSKTFPGSKDDLALSVIQASDGGYVIAGQAGSADNHNYDMFVIKTDAVGNVEYTE